MEDKVHIKRQHCINMENRGRASLTGITDVSFFDSDKVVLESDYGSITLKGANLHVSKLSVEKGELEVDGIIDSCVYSDSKGSMKSKENFFGKLLR